jgi:MFS family permease
MLMTVNALTVILMTPPVTHITMKLKPTYSIIFGGIQYAVGFGMIYYIKTIYPLIVSTVFWTLGEILIMTNSGVYVANNTPISHRGRFNAVFPVLTGAGYAFGPYLMGAFIDTWGIRPVWKLCFAMSICASFLMLGLTIFDSKYAKKNSCEKNKK